MTVYDYIEKYGLQKFTRWPNSDEQIPELLIDPQTDVFDI
jgi:hypothetical protein